MRGKKQSTLVSKVKEDVFEQPESIPSATSLEITGVSLFQTHLQFLDVSIKGGSKRNKRALFLLVTVRTQVLASNQHLATDGAMWDSRDSAVLHFHQGRWKCDYCKGRGLFISIMLLKLRWDLINRFSFYPRWCLFFHRARKSSWAWIKIHFLGCFWKIKNANWLAASSKPSQQVES